MAAVRAGGPGTALSHRAGTELWQLLPPSRGDIDITVHGRGGRKRRKGLRIHRSHLPEHEITMSDSIVVTTPARTLLDLRRFAAPEIYRRALRQAEYKGMDLTGLETDGTRSEPEADFIRVCRRHRLPPPEVNQRIGPFTVDFLWRRQRVVVEVDGWTAHRGRQAFEDDHERDLNLRTQGYRVLRFTARQIEREPGVVAAMVRTKLGV
jgi:very-short-patch-repair endonuclease